MYKQEQDSEQRGSDCSVVCFAITDNKRTVFFFFGHAKAANFYDRIRKNGTCFVTI